MKIGELDMKCGNCSIIDFCGEPYDDICLCGDVRLEEVDEKDFKRLAELSDRKTNKTICEDVIRTLKKEKYIYVLSIVRSEGYISGRESAIKLFRDKKECLEHAYSQYTNDYQENCTEDGYLKKSEFEKNLENIGYNVLQMPDFHIQYEFSRFIENKFGLIDA